MSENKTKVSDASVAEYLARIDNPSRRSDCEQLVALMGRATGERPKMWGTSIVGFGVHSYLYESGRQGETCRVGFASRKGAISIYGIGSAPGADALLAQLGQYKRDKGCLHIKKLSDVDAGVFEQLVVGASKST